MSVCAVSDVSNTDHLAQASASMSAAGGSILDVTSRAGIRVLALAEPFSSRRSQRYDAVAGVMGAVASFIATTHESDPAALLRRAFEEANGAVRAHNLSQAGSDPIRRAFVGLAMAAVAHGRLVIAFAAPGQILIIQNGVPIALPTPDGWQDGVAAVETAVPLGMFLRLTPVNFETQVTGNDLLVLGGRGFSQLLETGVIAGVVSGAPDEIEARLNDVLAAAQVVGDVFCGRIGTSPLRQATPAPVQRQKQAVPATAPMFAPIAVAPRRRVLDDNLPVVRFDRWHTKVIEASERWFARKQPRVAADEADERVVAALGRGSVRRYQPRHRVSPGFRANMPRYSHAPWTLMTVALIAVIALGGLGYGYNIRHARASKHVSYLSIVQQQYDLATAAPPTAGVPFLASAEDALHAAEKHGASAAVTSQWEGRLRDLRDSLQGIHRFTSVAPTGAPLADLGAGAQLIEMSGVRFVIAGSVFRVDADGSRLATLLSPGTNVDGRTAGELQNGNVDGDQLVVTDGKTLFRWSVGGNWSAEAMPARNGSDWLAAIHGAYLGNYYLLDASTSQILKFAQGQIGSAPVEWVIPANLDKIKGAVDMALDGSIQVLLADGSLETLFMGQEQAHVVISYEPGGATEVGLAGGANIAHLYVLERGKTATRLIRYTPGTGEKTQYQVAGLGQPGYTEAAVQAFNAATDFTVNEAKGTVAFLSGGTLWIAAFGN